MRSNQRGSATVEFLLVGLPFLGLTLLSCELLFSSYCKTIALDAASESAQAAALADSNLDIGVQTGKAVLNLTIPNIPSRVELENESIAGQQVTLARVTVYTPNILLGSGQLQVEARAVSERQ